MYRLYKKPIVKASLDVNIPQPRVSKLAVFILSFLARPYLFTLFGPARIVTQGDALFDAFKRALAGESRCIIAFRHPNGGEPQLLSWFFLFRLQALAAKKGIRFSRSPHAVFVYGYEVVRWGGWAARLVMPNIGAIPIHHSKIDSEGMARIFNAIVEGPYPAALAPEGQVSYTTDSVPRLENGIIRIGLQAARQLKEKNMNCPLEILPVSVHFRYDPWGKAAMERLLRKIEKFCGLSRRTDRDLPFTERLRLCRDRILQINEDRYNIKGDVSLSFEERLEKVINTALETAERMLGIKSDGDFFPRLYRVRHHCWDRIFLPNVDSFDGVPRIKRAAMDLEAGEAWYIARHQELADFGWYFRRPLPTEETALHNKIEYVQNLWDFANRTMGGALSNRVNIFPRKVIINSAPVINLSGRLSGYKENKKAAVAAILSDLEKAYLDSIDEMNKMKID